MLQSAAAIGLLLWSHNSHFEHFVTVFLPLSQALASSPFPHPPISKGLTHHGALKDAITLKVHEERPGLFIALHSSSLAHKRAHESIFLSGTQGTYIGLHSPIFFHNNPMR